ncbi:MAG: hypothetical protein K8H99_12175 [Nitrospirae bacterium]|nr:hypothetical protein [Fimbriimonadaceae bacterium]
MVEQFRAGLAMLADCVEKCPEDLWLMGAPQREMWRIAFHAAFFTHVYLVQDEAAYKPWPNRPSGKHEDLWPDPANLEPYELPVDAEPLTRGETLAFVAYLTSIVEPTINGLDFDRDSGYRWYRDFGKLSHVLMNLRHLQGHVGQLSELLMAKGIETEWVGKGSSDEWGEWLQGKS